MAKEYLNNMLNTGKKRYYILLPIILFSFFIFRFLIPQFSKDARCITYKEFQKIKLDGILIKKYIDSSQHSFPTLEVQNLGDSRVEKLNLNLDASGFYDKINLLDTLYKEVGKDEVYIKNNGKKIIMKIDFGCDNK
ncbi:hypothetical protein [Lacibacter sp. H407]|uniref:hypothetical protein n=1 Tax=Lacibacter sp. H407 TaxID=3133423 RepID=UPI0030C3DAD3